MKEYYEDFISPFEKNTKAKALEVLDSIRESHPKSKGWVEISGYAKKLDNGKWIAIRRHKKVG